LGDLYREQGQDTLALEAYNVATQRSRQAVWAYTALADYYAARGEAQQVASAYQAAIRQVSKQTLAQFSAPPETAPVLFPLRRLRQVEHPLGISVDKNLFVLGYGVAPAQLIPGKPLKLTLYWWNSSRSSVVGTLGIRWLTSAGQAIGPMQTYPTMWEPGYVVRWTYELSVPKAAQPGQLLQLQVSGPRGNLAPSAPFGSLVVQSGN
jgi:tetratricopeptide (TPR) repeat protein